MATVAVKYLVRLDPFRDRWTVLRDGQATGAFARDMNTAIGAATRDAGQESRDPGVKVSVWLELKGKPKKVWPPL